MQNADTDANRDTDNSGAKDTNDRRLAALGEKVDALTALLGQIDARLGGLHEECQRAASAGQRMLLRQEGLAKSLARLEDRLYRD